MIRADLRALPELPRSLTNEAPYRRRRVPVCREAAGVVGGFPVGFAAHRRGPTRGSIIIPVLAFVVAFIWRWRRP